MYDSADFVQRAVANGANGYLMKNAAPSELQHAVQTMLTTGSYFNGLRESPAADQAYDAGARERLRELSDRLAGLDH